MFKLSNNFQTLFQNKKGPQSEALFTILNDVILFLRFFLFVFAVQPFNQITGDIIG